MDESEGIPYPASLILSALRFSSTLAINSILLLDEKSGTTSSS